MLSAKENNFIEYWKNNREKERNIYRQLFFGLPFGLLLGIGILVLLESGWYERANMVAYAQSSPWLLVVAILLIAIFTGFFYKKYKWEMNEQQYNELIFKKGDNNSQTRATNSPVS